MKIQWEEKKSNKKVLLGTERYFDQDCKTMENEVYLARALKESTVCNTSVSQQEISLEIV